MVPPYSTGTWSGLIYFSKTSFQFAGRAGKEGERRVTARQDFLTAPAVCTKEAGKGKPSGPAHETVIRSRRCVHSTAGVQEQLVTQSMALPCTGSQETWGPVPTASGQLIAGVQ